jgi:hypothetical protein
LKGEINGEKLKVEIPKVEIEFSFPTLSFYSGDFKFLFSQFLLFLGPPFGFEFLISTFCFPKLSFRPVLSAYSACSAVTSFVISASFCGHSSVLRHLAFNFHWALCARSATGRDLPFRSGGRKSDTKCMTLELSDLEARGILDIRAAAEELRAMHGPKTI